MPLVKQKGLRAPVSSGAGRPIFCDVAPKSEEAPTQEPVGPDSRRAPKAWCS